MPAANTVMAVFQFDETTRRRFERIVRPLVETHTGLKYVDGSSYYEPITIKMDLIAEMIREARLVIVDVSVKNPNVFMELGIAYSLRKPLILLCSEQSWKSKAASGWNKKVAFDLGGRELLIFEDDNDLKVKLGRYISDSLYRTSEIAISWNSYSKDNHCKSSTGIEIHGPGEIWCASGVNSNFIVSCRVSIHQGKARGTLLAN